MGFFKRKVKEDQRSVYQMPPKYAAQYREPQDTVEMYRTPDGKLQIELIEPIHEPSRFYDTTRVVIDVANPLWIDGMPIQNCKVSHYNQDDAEILDSSGSEGACSRTCYRQVLAQFDVTRIMQGDEAYTKRLLSTLFDQKRIEKYLDGYALQENPAIPCGNYIGELSDDGRKHFNISIGSQVHNSSKYVELRRQQRAKEAKQAEINKHYEAIKRLNRGIDDDSDGR